MDELETKRADLERELHGADPNVGIAFGVDLFEEFRQRGWFTLERLWRSRNLSIFNPSAGFR